MNKYSGTNFDDFLDEEGLLEEVSERAQKRFLALQIQEIMNNSHNMVRAVLTRVVRPGTRDASKEPTSRHPLRGPQRGSQDTPGPSQPTRHTR